MLNNSIEIDAANIDVDGYESTFDLYVNGRDALIYCDFDVNLGEDVALGPIKLMPQCYLSANELTAVQSYIVKYLNQHIYENWEDYYQPIHKEYNAEEYLDYL